MSDKETNSDATVSVAALLRPFSRVKWGLFAVFGLTFAASFAVLWFLNPGFYRTELSYGSSALIKEDWLKFDPSSAIIAKSMATIKTALGCDNYERCELQSYVGYRDSGYELVVRAETESRIANPTIGEYANGIINEGFEKLRHLQENLDESKRESRSAAFQRKAMAEIDFKELEIELQQLVNERGLADEYTKYFSSYPPILLNDLSSLERLETYSVDRLIAFAQRKMLISREDLQGLIARKSTASRSLSLANIAIARELQDAATVVDAGVKAPEFYLNRGYTYTNKYIPKMAQNLGVSLAFAVSALAIFYIYCIFGIEDRSSENISESDSMTGKAMTRPAGATI